MCDTEGLVQARGGGRHACVGLMHGFPQGEPWALWGGRWRPPPRPGPPARTEGTIIHLGAHEGEQGLLTSTDARDGKTQLCLDSCQGHRHYCYHYQTAAYDSASCQARFVQEKYHQNWNHFKSVLPFFWCILIISPKALCQGNSTQS